MEKTIEQTDLITGASGGIEQFAEEKGSGLRPYTKREIMPGNLMGAGLENFIRDVAMTYSHETCTANIGLDSMSVVIRQRDVAFDSVEIMPRVTAENTMAPCVVIGERAAEMLKAERGF